MLSVDPQSVQAAALLKSTLPSEWSAIRLKFLLAAPITDGPHLTPEFTFEGFPFLSVDGIQNGELVFEACRYVSEEDHREFSKKAAPERDDILLGKAASTGKIARVKVDTEFSIWSPLALIRADTRQVLSAFLEYCLKSTLLQSQIDDLCSSNTQKNISMGDIPMLTLPLPSLEVQHSIASYLDRETARIDALITEKEHMLALLEEKRAALISRAVTRGLDPNTPLKPSGQEWLGEIPAHWPTTKFSWDVFISEGQVDPEDGRFSVLILVAPNHIESRTGQITHTETSADQGAISGKYLCKQGDVLYSKIRPALRKVALAEEDCLCSADMYALRPSEKLMPEYLQYFLLSEDFSTWAELESARVAMPKINRETLSAIRIPIPPLEEQECIVSEIRGGAKRIDLQRKYVRGSVELLKERRAALITAAVTGQVPLEAMQP